MRKKPAARSIRFTTAELQAALHELSHLAWLSSESYDDLRSVMTKIREELAWRSKEG